VPRIDAVFNRSEIMAVHTRQTILVKK